MDASARMPPGRPAAAFVDPQAAVANHREAARLAGGREVVAVVKADAYGHGAVALGRALQDGGARALAVLTVAEGVELREAGVALPILLMGGVHDPGEAGEAAARGLTPVLHEAGALARVAAAASQRPASSEPVPVEIEVDTGMRRMGVPPEAFPALAERVASTPGVRLAGVYTHLARAEEPDLAPSLEQLRAFAALLKELAARGVRPGRVHVANSAGVLRTAELEASLPPEVDAVRPGLMLYGIRPARALAPEVDLRPAMSVRCRVVAVRDVRPGDGVGYGATFRARRAGRIATLPLGYGDGVAWHLGGRGVARVRGRLLPFAGRVSMDYVTLDVAEERVEVGDEALLFGEASDGGRLPVEEQAERAGTIPYELVSRMGPRLPRVLVGA